MQGIGRPIPQCGVSWTSVLTAPKWSEMLTLTQPCVGPHASQHVQQAIALKAVIPILSCEEPGVCSMGPGLRVMVNMDPPGQGHPGGPRGGACRWTLIPRSQNISVLRNGAYVLSQEMDVFLQAALVRVAFILFWENFQITVTYSGEEATAGQQRMGSHL